MSTRTPGRLVIQDGYPLQILSAENGGLIAHAEDLPAPSYRASQLAHLVACWNALEDAHLTPEQVGPLVEAVKKVLADFEANVYQRNTDFDARPDWALRLTRSIHALAVLTQIVKPDPPQGDGGER